MSMPDPILTLESRPFWEAAENGVLLIGYCSSCDKPHFYPRRICPFCLSPGAELRPVGGTGVIHSFSVMRRADQSYVIAYVELAEGVTVLTNLTDCQPEDLVIGQPVTLRFSRSSSGMAVPVFGPAPDS